jgi:Fur family zinc uptake transcriptional regulator
MTMKHSHDHKACRADAMARAEHLCEDEGARLTPIRRKVLELIWASHKAVKAYDLLEQLDKQDGALAPATVYRALDFLLERKLIHKIESLNAFIGCAHPDDRHSCQFFICDSCGDVREGCDAKVAGQIDQNAKESGFQPAWQMLEVHGTCAACQ